VLAGKNLVGDEVDALLEGMYEIEDAGLEDRRSMNAVGRMVLHYHGTGLIGNSIVLVWVVGRRHCSLRGFLKGWGK